MERAIHRPPRVTVSGMHASGAGPSWVIEPARAPEHWQDVRRLFLAYADGLGFDLGFQRFAEELDSLPGDYAEPRGCVLLAWVERRVVGCVGLRRLEGSICEMKRLFVEPDHRGTGLGRELVCGILEQASSRGYDRMRLDTVPAMRAARALYASLGFEEIEPYRFNPIGGTSFMERRLRRRKR